MVFKRVVFFTLSERRNLDYIQLGKGSNKFLFKGTLLLIGDILKLFFKEVNYPNN